jgi:hypothetical protein
MLFSCLHLATPKVSILFIIRMIVFSFTLFGSEDKYCKGMIRNAEEIQKRFPEAKTYIFCGNDIPDSILSTLESFPSVQLFKTNQIGLINKIYRYLPIDDPDVDVCIVRDADSRVYDRDETSIRDFLKSDKLCQIIRDHKVHKVAILGGMVSFKKGCLLANMRELIGHFITEELDNKPFEFEDDQNFLKKYIYPLIVRNALIQDEYDQPFEPPEFHTKISKPRVFPHFIGQIYIFNEKGEEVTVCGGP